MGQDGWGVGEKGCGAELFSGGRGCKTQMRACASEEDTDERGETQTIAQENVDRKT